MQVPIHINPRIADTLMQPEMHEASVLRKPCACTELWRSRLATVRGIKLCFLFFEVRALPICKVRSKHLGKDSDVKQCCARRARVACIVNSVRDQLHIRLVIGA